MVIKKIFLIKSLKILSCKLKMNRQNNDQKKKDKISTKHYTEN